MKLAHFEGERGQSCRLKKKKKRFDDFLAATSQNSTRLNVHPVSGLDLGTPGFVETPPAADCTVVEVFFLKKGRERNCDESCEELDRPVDLQKTQRARVNGVAESWSDLRATREGRWMIVESGVAGRSKKAMELWRESDSIGPRNWARVVTP